MKKTNRAAALAVALAMLTASLPASAADAGTSVRINEICTQNRASLRDSYGKASDWIELYHAGSGAADLSGWTLSDSKTVFTFPQGYSLAAGSCTVIFASKQNSAGNELHTGFALSKNGETLTLKDEAGRVVQEIAVPPLSEDETFGMVPDTGEWAVMQPSPGKANFKAVVIYNAWYYTEKASGNTICFFNNSEASNFIVAKGKTVNELTLFNTNKKLYFNYILRKGASINNIVYMIYSDGVANVSTYESKTRTVTINDPDGTACAYVKLDKKGRVKSIKGIEWIGDTETEYDFKYSYDKNGNSTGIYISKDSYERDELFEYDSKGHTVKVLTHEINDGVEFNTLKSNSYDEKGRLIKSVYTNENDGTEIGCVTYEYNKKGRCIRQYQANPDGSWYEVTRTYNSKGFRSSQTEKTSSGDISTEVFKYNKAGDLLKDINTLTDGSVYTYMYSYNENGKYLKTEVIGPDGERKEL